MALYADGKGKYQSEFNNLWEKLVPLKGVAHTIEGELIRSIGRIARESYVNGCCNWNSEYDKMVVTLSSNLLRGDRFTVKEKKRLKNDLKKIRQYGLGEIELEFDGEDPWDRVTDKVVEWCLPELQKK